VKLTVKLSLRRHKRKYRPVCLGCGCKCEFDYCVECDKKTEKLIAFSHWPLEIGLSPAALKEVELGVRARLAISAWDLDVADVCTELTNLANIIRAHLQHVQARNREILKKQKQLILKKR
jgi:hypothetical protein